MKTLLLFSLLLTAATSRAAIYGEDNMRTLSKSRAGLRPAASAVALMVPNSFLRQREDGRYDIDTATVSDSWGLCSDEPYANQPSLYVGCTGFLVGEDLLLTAGHCSVNQGVVEHENNPFCRDFSWVFDVNDVKSKAPMTNIDAGQVFECQEIIKAVHTYDFIRMVGDEAELRFRQDWGLVRLKRKTGRTALPLTSRAPQVGERMEMLGHPMAMQLMSSSGQVLADKGEYFSGTFDGFGGNSGSPILNAAGEVAGILVRGYPDDTVTDEKLQCERINRCSENGASCTKNDAIYEHGDQGQKITAEILALIRASAGAK